MANPPRKRDQVQRDHEMAIARRFIDYRRSLGEAWSDPTPGDPSRLAPNGDDRGREPDALSTGPKGPAGVEVTCPYYDREHAKATWRLAEGAAGPMCGSAENPDAKLLRALQLRLDEKARKAYTVPTYLVLDAWHAELNSFDEAPEIAAALSVPDDHPFRGIYLHLRMPFSAETGFYELAAPGEQLVQPGDPAEGV